MVDVTGETGNRHTMLNDLDDTTRTQNTVDLLLLKMVNIRDLRIEQRDLLQAIRPTTNCK